VLNGVPEDPLTRPIQPEELPADILQVPVNANTQVFKRKRHAEDSQDGRAKRILITAPTYQNRLVVLNPLAWNARPLLHSKDRSDLVSAADSIKVDPRRAHALITAFDDAAQDDVDNMLSLAHAAFRYCLIRK